MRGVGGVADRERRAPATSAADEPLGTSRATYTRSIAPRACPAPAQPAHSAPAAARARLRVGEHEHRVLAAELDRHLLLARDALARDRAPDGGRAREQDLADRRLRQRHADVARRRARAARAPPAGPRAPARARSARPPGRARGGLEDDAVARQQRARDLPERLRERRAAGADHRRRRRRARTRPARAWRATSSG